MEPPAITAPAEDDTDEHTDDELPTSSVAELTISSSSLDRGMDEPPRSEGRSAARMAPSMGETQERRSVTHFKLRAYEAKRRMAYESKLQSSSLYWHAFRTLMHDSLLETEKAFSLLRGWTHASEAYGESMVSVGEWCVDEKGAPIVDVRKKKKHFEASEKVANHSSGGAVGGDTASLFPGQQLGVFGDKSGASVIADFYREEKCGSMILDFAESARVAAGKYEEMSIVMREEVLPDLSSLLDHLKTEVVFTSQLGESLMNELETAEDAVCQAWDLYCSKTNEHKVTPDPPENSGAQVVAEDVWVEEMRYRMAVAFLSSVWEKCSSELSKLFLSMKDAECSRRNQLKSLLIKAAEQQEQLWQALPSVISPVLTELTEWPLDRKSMEEDVQHSIRERAQAIQRDEAEHRKPEDDGESNSSPAAQLVGDNLEVDGNFELSSPLVSDLLRSSKVIEKRSGGIMSGWKVSLAVITSDSYLHLFELPSTCKLSSGSAPEVAFQNLIPPVVVPSMEGVKAGVKFPSSKYWFDNLVPSESLALPNCVVSMKDDKHPNVFEVVETILTSGASKMFTKTMTRKMQFRAVTQDEARDLVDMLTNFD